MATSRDLTTATSIRQETVEVRSGLGPDTAAGMRTDEAGTELVIRAERPEGEAFLDRLACAVEVEGFRPRLAPTQPDSSSVFDFGGRREREETSLRQRPSAMRVSADSQDQLCRTPVAPTPAAILALPCYCGIMPYRAGDVRPTRRTALLWSLGTLLSVAWPASTASMAINVDADFAFAASDSTVSVTRPGSSGTTTLTITGQPGYSSTINFSSACSSSSGSL